MNLDINKKLKRRVVELSEIAVMQHEVGKSAIESISSITKKALEEGIINEIKIYGAR